MANKNFFSLSLLTFSLSQLCGTIIRFIFYKCDLLPNLTRLELQTAQQLCFCCSPWWKSNLQSWFAIILLQLLLQSKSRGFFQLMVMLSHQRKIFYYLKMHKKSCSCMKICHFWGLTTENCEILPINLVSMQFMKISVSVKIYSANISLSVEWYQSNTTF